MESERPDELISEFQRCLDELRGTRAERKRAEEEILLLQRIIIAITESENMDAALFAVLERICGTTEWVYGEVWVPDLDGKLLERNPVWYGEAAGLGDFSASSEGFKFPPGDGLPGRVWASRKPLWIDDVTLDMDYKRKDMARDAGLRTAVAIPVLSRDEVVAVMVFYMFKVGEEDEMFVRVLSAIAAHLGSVIRRKKAEDELRRREEYFRSLIENNLDIVTLLAKDGTILYESPSVKNLFGYEPEELTGKNAFDYVHPDDLPLVKNRFRLIVESPLVTQSAEFRFRHKDGTWRILESVGKSALEPLKGVIVNSRDITGFRRTEELFRMEKDSIEAQLRQSQKMEAVGQLASGVAHEFNNLMTVIEGNADIALSKVGEEEPASINLKEILRIIARGATLTRELLTFGRSQPMEKRNLNINQVIEGISKVIRHLIGENISIKTELGADLWNIEADQGQMEQILMNLVINSKDAMPDGGRLFIKTGNVNIDEAYCRVYGEARTGRFVCVSVEDTGMGMDADTLPRIFEPFFTTKETSKGTGLGLSVVYGIVKGHNGWINVYSSPGKGSVFKCYFPAVYGEVEEKEGRIELPEAYGGKEGILLVEDERDVREITERMLEGKGYKVFVASNCEEAVSIFREKGGEIDLLFTDMMLPDRSGLELADELKGKSPKLRFLITSGYSADHLKFRGDYHFIGKPFSMMELLRAIREAMEGSSKGQ